MTQRSAIAACFLALIVAANAALNRWGVIDFLGLAMPAGVFFAGLTFGVRDALHERGGIRWVLPCIAAGAALSWLLEDGATIPGGHVSIAVASGLAFGLSELADLAIYSPLRRSAWPAAVAASNLAGAAIDSALFLWLAFGSLEFFEGQIVGKLLMVLPAIPAVAWARQRPAPALA